MIAVAKTAVRGYLDNICKQLTHTTGIIHEAELAHTRCVDEQATLGNLDEIATRGRVAALFVATCRTRVLSFAAEQTVHDG